MTKKRVMNSPREFIVFVHSEPNWYEELSRRVPAKPGEPQEPLYEGEIGKLDADFTFRADAEGGNVLRLDRQNADPPD